MNIKFSESLMSVDDEAWRATEVMKSLAKHVSNVQYGLNPKYIDGNIHVSKYLHQRIEELATKEEKEKKEMERLCNTCRYYELEPDRGPCRGCYGNNWTSNEKKEEKKEMTTKNLHIPFLSRYDLYSGGVKVKIGNKTYLPSSVTMERSDKEYSTWELTVDSRDYIHTDGEDILEIKDVIFNPPATIVFWKDGTKTVVKADGEEFDAEKGLAMAFSKKFLGNKYDYYNTFKHWLKRAPGCKKEK